MSLLDRYIPSQEAIAVQGKSMLFRELTAAFQAFLDQPERSTAALNGFKIETILEKHVGFPCTVLYSPSLGTNAFAMPPTIDINNPIMSRWRRSIERSKEEFDDYVQGEIKDRNIDKQALDIKIDLKNSRITGDFMNAKHRIELGGGLFNGKMTAGEIAAILLHEVGHIFTFYDWMRRTATTSVILEAAWGDMVKSNDVNRRLVIVDKTTKALNLNGVDAEKLANSRSKEYFYTVYLTTQLGEYRSTLGSRSYDTRISEQAADQFAARHGAARELATGLAKLHRSAWDPAYMHGALYYAIQALKVTALVVGLALGIPHVIGFALTMLIIGVIGLFMESTGELEYDTPEGRTDKIIQELTLQLKNRELSSDVREKLLADHMLLTELRKKIKDRHSFYDLIWRNVTSNRRDQHKQLKFQQELEKLVNNDIFVKSQQLHTFL